MNSARRSGSYRFLRAVGVTGTGPLLPKPVVDPFRAVSLLRSGHSNDPHIGLVLERPLGQDVRVPDLGQIRASSVTPAAPVAAGGVLSLGNHLLHDR